LWWGIFKHRHGQFVKDGGTMAFYGRFLAFFNQSITLKLNFTAMINNCRRNVGLQQSGQDFFLSNTITKDQ
jgi:hypothetical protein